MPVLCEKTQYCIFYRQFSSPLCYEREGVFTKISYRLGCSISIKMDSQPCGGTIHNKPTQCVFSQLHATQPFTVMQHDKTPTLMPATKQAGSLYYFYDGLWYRPNPAGTRTHDLPLKRQFRPPIALRTDLSHITIELWEIPVLRIGH